MPFRLLAALLLLVLGSAFAADESPGIRLDMEPVRPDSQPAPFPMPLKPAAPPPFLLNIQPLSPLLLNFNLQDSMLGKKPFDFAEYWAQVEKENGIDALRRQLSMANSFTSDPDALSPGLHPGGLNFLGGGMLLYQAWKVQDEKARRERRFQLKVDGLMDLAARLEGRKGAAQGISIILAKLDFMGKRVAGRLPNRPDRRQFTENLKAWAVNPVFDSTGMGPALLEVCRFYEEYEQYEQYEVSEQ